jgi:hypothetical protein
MKLLRFNFQNEAKWIMIFSLGVPAIGILVAIVVILLRQL